jgi:hypothetical protein
MCNGKCRHGECTWCDNWRKSYAKFHTEHAKRPSARRKYEPPAVKQTISFDDIRAEFEKAQAEE